MLVRLLALAALVVSCASSSSSTVSNAIIQSTIAMSAAAIEKGNGNCIAVCTNGTGCNHDTGFCEPLPCRDACTSAEICQSGRCIFRDSAPPLMSQTGSTPATQPASKRQVW